MEEVAMPQTVEIRLRIPSLRAHGQQTDSPSVIANDDVRFIKQVELAQIPRRGELLTMTTESGATFQCEVVRSDWHDDKNMFVIACRYARRTISEAEYRGLMDAPDWRVTAIL
jgi:hypothetical protein